MQAESQPCRRGGHACQTSALTTCSFSVSVSKHTTCTTGTKTLGVIKGTETKGEIKLFQISKRRRTETNKRGWYETALQSSFQSIV